MLVLNFCSLSTDPLYSSVKYSHYKQVGCCFAFFQCKGWNTRTTFKLLCTFLQTKFINININLLSVQQQISKWQKWRTNICDEILKRRSYSQMFAISLHVWKIFFFLNQTQQYFWYQVIRYNLKKQMIKKNKENNFNVPKLSRTHNKLLCKKSFRTSFRN